MQITLFTEVTSSWCYWAEPAWAELKQRYEGRADFQWKIALMDATGLPKSTAQTEWFYRRSGLLMRSPFSLNPGWFEPGKPEYLAPNLIAEAARDLGVNDDRVRLAIANAALREGRKVGEWEIAAAVGASAADLDEKQLLTRARMPEVEARVRATTAEFHAMQVTQRPTFLIENELGDRAVFSGFAQAAPIMAAIDALLADAAGYASHRAHYGDPPTE